MDFFVNLLIGKIVSFYLKLILMPAFTLVILYIIYVIMLKVRKPTVALTVDSKLTLLKSISITIVLYNIFWLYVIYTNGVYMFNWAQLSFSKNNIYFMLSPILSGYLVLLFLYFRTQSQIKKLL